jgi:lysophospholipase L1-like esterase
MNKKDIIMSVCLGTGTILLFFVIFEVFVRVKYDTGMNYDLEMWKYAQQLKRISTDPKIGHEHQPSKKARLMGVDVSINSLGLRGPEIPLEKAPNERRILMLGDSLTFGWGVAEQSTTARRLESALGKMLLNQVSVINAGVGNYNTEMEVSYFMRDGIRLKPDMVILNYFINDAEPTPAYDGHPLFDSWSYAYVLLKGRTDTFMRMMSGQSPDWAEYYQNLYKKGHEGWERTKQSIMELAKICRQYDLTLMLVVYPEIRDIKNYRFKEIHQNLKDLAENQKIYFLDLLDSVAGLEEPKLWVTKPDPHPNDLANFYFADAIQKKISRLQLLSTNKTTK